jgi:beta-glucanase (GH16 family)
MTIGRFFLMLMLIFTMVSLNSAEEKKWYLIWQDEFDAPANTGIDTTKWRYNLWEPGTVNGEAQKYTDRIENVFHDGKGHVVLRGLKDGWKGYRYTSGRLESEDRIQFHYTNKVVVRAILPRGRGSWPALWLLASKCCWPGTGEIDFMEQFGDRKGFYQCDTHTGGQPGDGGRHNNTFPTESSAGTEFHEYGVEWYRDSLIFTIDGGIMGDGNNKAIVRYNGGPFNINDHYIILNVALGGAMGGGIDDNQFPMDMVVDWVRVYSDTLGPQSVFPGNTQLSSGLSINPTIRTSNHEIVVSTPQSANMYNVDLVSPTGRIIRTSRLTKNEARLNTSDLPAGIYCLRVRGKESLWSRTIYVPSVR